MSDALALRLGLDRVGIIRRKTIELSTTLLRAAAAA
jgi:hypothetical protein